MAYKAPKISNVDNYNAARAVMSTDMQNRLPLATVQNMRDIGLAITSDKFQLFMNEWQSALFNKIGLTIFREYTLTNPLAKYIYGRMDFGDAIEEIGTGLLKGAPMDYGVDGESVDPFIITSPEAKTSYHRINQPIQYACTIKRDQLNHAFTRPYGVARLIGMFVNSMYSSANVDSWLMTKKAMAWYLNDGMAAEGYSLLPNQKVGVSPLTDEDSIKDFIIRVKDAIAAMSFPQADYNPMGVPKQLNKPNLVLFLNAKAMNRISVKAISAAINPAELGFNVRIEPMDDFGTDPLGGTTTDVVGVLAEDIWLLITEQFQDMDMIRNPRGRYFNYFLTRQMSFGTSYFGDVAIFRTSYPVKPLTVSP